MADAARFETYEREDGRWGWRLRHSNGDVLATDHGQGYENRNDCQRIGLKVCLGSFDVSW